MNELYITELYGKSERQLVRELGERFRRYRIALRLTQEDIAEQSGLCKLTVARFERGDTGSINLDKFLALLRTIQRLEDVVELIPDVPENLYSSAARKGKETKRVRRKRNER